MDFRFLYKADRHLFSIGCNLAQGRLDASCYDLLATESCLTSFLAVARGRGARGGTGSSSAGPFIQAAGRIGLLSWGGTMFEYLMPRLLLKALPGTLLDRDDRARPSRGRSSTASRTACPGGSPSRASRRSTPTATTSTSRSACRASA